MAHYKQGRKQAWKSVGSKGFTTVPASRNDCGRYAFSTREEAKAFNRARRPSNGKNERYVPYECPHCNLFHLIPRSHLGNYVPDEHEVPAKVLVYTCRNCHHSLEWIKNFGWVHQGDTQCAVPYPACEHDNCDHGAGPDITCDCLCHEREDA